MWEYFIIKNGIGHFESVKMHLFLVLLVIATLEVCFTKWEYIKKISKKKTSIISWSLIIGLLICWVWLYPHDTLRDLFLWIWEKQHGLLLPISLIWLSLLVSLLDKSELRNIRYAIVFSWFLMAIVAIIEYFGYDIFTGASYTNEWSWWDVRSTSTLGNPNYVAGYLLIILPIVVSMIRRVEKYWILIIFSLWILMTKSLIGIVFGWCYLLFLLVKRYGWRRYVWIFSFMLITILTVVSLHYGGSEKWLSLTSRFILMKLTIIASLDSITWVLFGHGPSAVIWFFSDMRPPEIQAYFPNSSIIDSSHNIFIDIFANYGLIWISLFIGYIMRSWKYLSRTWKSWILLGLSFLSLNVLVISHMILIVYLFSLREKAS
jgi:hypothetical protein